MLTTSLLLSMADIASVTKVRRPVVTMWRARSATSDLPFPHPIPDSGSPLLFHSDQVVRWLEETGRGNNTFAGRDAAAHAAAPKCASFDSISALLALRASTGRSLATLSIDELLDLADAADPNDEAVLSEIDPLTRPQALAHYVDEPADAAYGDAAAYERMLGAERRRPDHPWAGRVFTNDGLRLVARVVASLESAIGSDAGAEYPVKLVDPTGATIDVIVEIARDGHAADKLGRLGPGIGRDTARDIDRAVGHGASDSDETNATPLRRARRRLVAHGIPRADPTSTSRGQQLHLLIAGASANSTNALSILSAVDDLAMRLGDSQLALVVAPSAVLSDAGFDRDADLLRSGVLRSGQVRAIARLPTGLWAGMPRQSLSLWVLGAAHPDIDLAGRWTMVADLSTMRRSAHFDSDLAASLGSHSPVRAHAFRFARLVFTRHLLAGGDSLVSATPSRQRGIQGVSAVHESVKIKTLLAELSWPADALMVTPVPSIEPPARLQVATIEHRLAGRQLRNLTGNRLDQGLIESAPALSGRIAVVGVEELTGEAPAGSRSIDRTRFVAELPLGRFTKPGDVVYCTSPRTEAVVEHDGLSIVPFLARILRIRQDGVDELLPDVLAADINERHASDTSWRSWATPGVEPRQRNPHAHAQLAPRRPRSDTEPARAPRRTRTPPHRRGRPLRTRAHDTTAERTCKCFIFPNLRMVGGFEVLILSHIIVALPLILFIMMSFFDSLPLELKEQGQVDGLTPIGGFLRIALPLSVPGVATAGILSFICSWNDLMFALVLSGSDTKTLPVAIFDFVAYASIDWGTLMAAAVVITVPIMLIALFAQKYIVSGLTAGSTKGYHQCA